MTRSRSRSGRVLDALVVALAVPTVAIAATMGFFEYDIAPGHALATYRAALARCDEASGTARAACRSDAVATRRDAGRSADEAAQHSADVADALARAQCDVLTGYSTDACGGTGRARWSIARAQPGAHLAATDDARAEELIAGNPRPAR